MSDEEIVNKVEQEDLFEIDPDWKKSWVGMSSYEHQNLQPDTSLLVHFAKPEDRVAFAKLIGQNFTKKTKSIWFPKAEIRKASDKVWTGKQVTPRNPIYIISKGRWESRLTSKALEWIKVPYHIVVEPQEYDNYAVVIDPKKILVTPFSNLGQGGIPARNFVWEHAISTGAKRHFILDDNISGFALFNDNLKVELNNGATFCMMEDFADRYENLVMCAFQYDYFAPRKQGSKIKPITWNTRCYSAILLRNDITDVNGEPMRWRSRYNEDTDLSLRILKDGWDVKRLENGGHYSTALFNAFLCYKKPTLTMKGGNTDELYAGAEAMAKEWETHIETIRCTQCKECVDGYPTEARPRAYPCEEGRKILSKDGRWLMAESLREQHPDCTTVERKWRRWQHAVDYRRFKYNKLILRPDVVIEKNDYGLELDAMPTGWGAMGHDARNSAMGASPKPITIETKPVLQAVIESGGQANGPSAMDFVLGQPDWTTPPAPPVKLGPTAAMFKRGLEARGHRLLKLDNYFFVTEMERLTAEDETVIKAIGQAALLEVADEWDGSEDSALSVVADGRADISSGQGDAVLSGDMADGGIKPSASLFDEPRPHVSLAQFLGSEPSRVDPDYVPDEPPDLTGIDEVVLNFATSGLNWHAGDRPVGVTVSTMDGKLCRFLPFGFAGGNLDEETIKRWAREQLRNKKITNSKTKFDIHHAREWGIDLEEQGCTFSDIQHTAALLDDHRKRFALDVLAADYLPDLPPVARVDEGRHHEHHAAEVVAREKHTAELVWRLRDAMYPEVKKQELRTVHDLEDQVIPTVVEMEKNGSPIDEELLEQFGRECREKHNQLMMEIGKEAGFAFEHSASGWKRLIEKLNLEVPDSFSEGSLNEVDHPLISKGQRASQYASLNSKIFKSYPEHIRDGKLRYDINQLVSDEGGTVSGRFSIGVVQQVPNADNHSAVFGDELFPRRLFIPGAGDYLEADAAQIEFRLLVHYSGNAALIKAYQDDPRTSFHKTMHAKLKTYKPDMLYTHTKSYNFAAQYGARSIKLATMMGFITEREGDEIRGAKRWNDPRLNLIHEIEAAYKQAHPEAGALLDRASHLAKPECDKYCKKGDALHRKERHRGYVKTLLGRRSRFPTNYKTYIGLNRVLQGTGADIMKKKLVELHAMRKETGFVMRITNHDAVLGDATTTETLEKVSVILNRQSYDLKVPILWEMGTGRSWAGVQIKD